MDTKLSNALDDCLYRLANGESVEACLDGYPKMSERLRPFLGVAQSISAADKILPSDRFREVSKAHLITRLREEQCKANNARTKRASARPNFRLALAITLAVVFAFAGSIFLPDMLRSSSTAALACTCTLSVAGNRVEVQVPGSDVWIEGTNGLTLEAGARVRTAPDSRALLTFLEGSTIKLEPNTELEVQRLEVEENGTAIVLKQWAGRTWSRVTKMLDPGSRYEIETPSAYALVRGTAFMVEFSPEGLTNVEVTEGVVSVGGQGEEVSVPAGYELSVNSGEAPPYPTFIPPGQSDEGPPGVGPDGQGPPGQSEDGPPGVGPDGQGPPGQTKDKDVPPGQSDEGAPGQTKDKNVPPGQDKDKNVPPGQDKDKD